jgi:hypothetical protein
MRAKHLLGEKMNKHHSAAIPGMSELGTDQYFGTYKWSKDVAGHDGKKQTAPRGDGPSFKDAPVVGGISKTERNMAKKAAGGKTTKMTPDGSKEHKDVQTDSPISGSKLKEARMSTAVKLQRAWERQQAKSAASRRRGEELLNPPKKEEPKKTTEGAFHNPGEEDSPVANALTRRILLQRTDLLAKYGPVYVGQAIDDVADSVGEVEEIGSSDVSGWIRQVEWNLKNKINQYDEPMEQGVAEVRKANTASARRELGKRTKKPTTLSPQEQELKKKDNDESWARLVAYMDDAKKKQGIEEMDKSAPQPGRDGHVSHKTYGTRDRFDVGGKEYTAKALTAKQMMDKAHKAMLKSMSNDEKVDKGWRNPNTDVKESKMSEADAILRQIAEDEDWDLLYKIHGMAGRPTPEGMAGNIIDDMYQDVAIDSGHHADDDFEEIYNTVLDRIIEQYGIEESVQVNEVDPRNFDSDWDYYDAVKRSGRSKSDDYEPPEKEDPYAEFEREQERRRAKAAKTEPTMVYSNEEGHAPNGKRYNMTVKFTSSDKHRADYTADRWVDSEWGAKKLVDKEQHEHNGETVVTIYVQDNHKHGYWKPWKDEEPISKGVSFEATNEDLGYKFNTGPKFMPRDTLGTDMSYHWGRGGGNKYGIDSKLGPREDPRFGKRDDGKQGYRPEYQKPSEYDHGTDKPQRPHGNELHKLLSKHGQLNSKLRRLEKSNEAGSKDMAIKTLQREIDSLERVINDMGGSDFLRHYTESLQQSLNLTKLEETFVAKFANKYKGK